LTTSSVSETSGVCKTWGQNTKESKNIATPKKGPKHVVVFFNSVKIDLFRQTIIHLISTSTESHNGDDATKEQIRNLTTQYISGHQTCTHFNFLGVVSVDYALFCSDNSIQAVTGSGG
jgi:hypothetical protein